MKASRCLITSFVVLASGICAWAQAPAQPSRGGPAPAVPATNPAVKDFNDRVLPELQFDNVGFDNVVDFLRDVAPDFRFTVVRDPGVPPEYPVLTIRLRDVTIGQFLKLLETAYGIRSTRIPGPNGDICLISIDNSNRVTAFMQFGHPSQESIVRMYNVSDIIESLNRGKTVNGADLQKQALNDVLSVLQAALDQTEGGNKATLKVHEGTRTLLVKGTAAQIGVVEEALQTLRPTASAEQVLRNQLESDRQAVINRSAEQQARDQASLDRLNAELQDMRNQLRNSLMEMQRIRAEDAILKAQLEQAQKATTKPKE